MIQIFNILLIPAVVVFSNKRLLQYLRYFQQEEYNQKRFFKWYLQNKAFDKKATLAIILISLIYIIANCNCYNFFLLIILNIALFWIAEKEENPTKTGKITLKMTARAKRIFYLSLFLSLLFFTAISLKLSFLNNLIFVILYFQILAFFLPLATFILSFDEKRRQRTFIQEAKTKLKNLNPYIIGITGSYGKTSTKAILAKLIETSLAPTFAPPKSINTEMGITRELREKLEAFHKYAVIEMGAYLPGSIRKLCKLTPPQAGIITAVGVAHLERFKTPENVLLAKSELAQAIPQDGILICNGDNAGSRKISEMHKRNTTKIYGMDKSKGHLDYIADDLRFSKEGTTFRISFENKSFLAFTKLSGRPNISNILGSFALAHTLGANPEILIAAIRNLEPFDNRLDVKQMSGYTQINDAYNSNPDGFKAALEVLEQLDGKKRF